MRSDRAQTESAGEVDRFATSGHAQFHQDVRHVIAHGLRRHPQAAGDVGISETVGEQGEDFVFPIGECREHRPPTSSDLGSDHREHTGSEHRRSTGDGTDGREDLGGGRRLHQASERLGGVTEHR